MTFSYWNTTVPKFTNASIVRIGSVDAGCGILLKREGWPSVYLEFVLELVDAGEPGQLMARLEAAGDFGCLAKGILKRDRSDPIYSSPLECVGRPNSRLLVRPVEKLPWAKVKTCADLQVKVEALSPSIHGSNGESVSCP